MISIVILTENEEPNLPSCLRSVNWSDDVHVLDSGSTDKTVEIARQFNTHVAYNPFSGFGSQRNFALDQLPLKYDWIFFLDADETVTEGFKNAMIKEIKMAGNNVAGFFCCWKMMLEGKWLKRCDNFPKWQFRIMRKGMARFKDFGHGQKEDEIAGAIGYIKEPYMHNGFSKGWHHWIDRHNRYSSQEAIARLDYCPPFNNVFARQGTVRNIALRSWLSKLPGWPLMRFIYTYFLRLGFIEGMPGLIYCTSMGYYEFLIQVKMREIKKNVKAKEATTYV